MKYIDTEKVIIKSWCNNPEQGAIEQAKNLANLPFIYKQVCLMPDTHQGYGMPIGGVIACQNAIVPNAVGVDIGCGMIAVQTTLEKLDIEKLKLIMSKIREQIPVGFHHRAEPLEIPELPQGTVICKQEYNAAKYQVGTLGGGNHFIEIQKSSDGYIWFMIHSGSRNLGKKVCDYYNKVAKELNNKWHSSVPPEWDLAFLPPNSEEGMAYLEEMNFCLDFAQKNRNTMADIIMKIFEEETGAFALRKINIHHNYASLENHFNKNLWVHRKGATSAREGQMGIIPGSQGTKSYIVKGKGNPESFMSCSHGAGRKMGRKQATLSLNLKEEQRKMEEQGIIGSLRTEKDLEEAAGAYKDISTVMEEQKDLVDIVTELTPLGVIKG